MIANLLGGHKLREARVIINDNFDYLNELLSTVREGVFNAEVIYPVSLYSGVIEFEVVNL